MAGGTASLVDRLASRWGARADRTGDISKVPGADGGAQVEPVSRGHDRRSFLTRITLGASALTVDPLRFVLEPVSAWDAVCGSGNTCGEGWSVFCCTINNGSNSCPAGSFVAGWWKSDASSFCGGGPRYIIDCNQACGAACTCTCPTGTCDNRRTCCNQFRYGQCHQEITCAGPVRCRMVTCAPPWVVDATCTTASATDNRTSDHNAPCNVHTPYTPFPAVGALPSAGFVTLNGDGRIEAFGIDRTSTAIHNVFQYQIGSGWSAWFPIGGTWPVPGSVAAGRNADTSLQVFVPGTGGQIFTAHQGPIGTGWSGFIGMGGTFQTPPAVGRSLDGRLQLFAVGTDGKLWRNNQLAPNGLWTGWTDAGGSFAAEPVIGTTTDGRMFAVCVGTDTKLYGMAQTSANGAWTPLVAIGGTHQGRPAIGRNLDGTLVVACPDLSGRLVVYRQSGFGWTVLQTFATPMDGPACIGRNQDGRLELFILGTDGSMHHSWQGSPNGMFVPWYPMASPPAPTTYVGAPTVISNPDGRLEVFVRGTDGMLWHDFQNVPNSGWFGPTYLGGDLVG